MLVCTRRASTNLPSTSGETNGAIRRRPTSTSMATNSLSETTMLGKKRSSKKDGERFKLGMTWISVIVSNARSAIFLFPFSVRGRRRCDDAGGQERLVIAASDENLGARQICSADVAGDRRAGLVIAANYDALAGRRRDASALDHTAHLFLDRLRGGRGSGRSVLRLGRASEHGVGRCPHRR